MKAIFICDNKDEWNTYSMLFKTHFPKIELICKLDIVGALKYIQEEGMPLFTIIDSLIKVNSLEDIFHKVYVATDKRPVVFIGAEKERQALPLDFYEVNRANGIVQRPLQLMQFKETIKKLLKVIHTEMMELASVELNKNDCLPIKIRNFYRIENAAYDVYLELSESKFVKIIHKGEPILNSQIQKFIRKKVKFFYLEKRNHLEFLENSLVSLLMVLGTPKLPKETVLATQIQAVMIIHEYVRTVGVSDKIILLTKRLIAKTDRIYRFEPDFVGILKAFPLKARDMAEQAVLTMYLCQAILMDMGWGNEIMRSKLGLASIIHDCLITDEDLINVTSLHDPNFEMFDKEDQENYALHPMKTAELALDFQGFPESEFLISQHHELPNGKGFPQGLNSHQITALSCVFILATNFIAEICKKPLKKSNINKIIKDFHELYDVGNFKAPLKCLKKIFKDM